MPFNKKYPNIAKVLSEQVAEQFSGSQFDDALESIIEQLEDENEFPDDILYIVEQTLDLFEMDDPDVLSEFINNSNDASLSESFPEHEAEIAQAKELFCQIEDLL